MTKISLLTLLTNPLTNTVAPQKINAGDSKVQAFQFDELLSSQDEFSTNPMNLTFKSKAEIEQLAKSSPRIMALLKEYNLPLKVNTTVLEEMR